MNIHRLALVKWLFREMFGALSAGGDTTVGSSSNANAETAAGMDNPDKEPDLPLDELKTKCALA